MWLIADRFPIRLEAMDHAGNILAGISATLTHLDEEQAFVTLEKTPSNTCFHWGSPVCFQVEDGLRRYVISGKITAKKLYGSETEHAAEGSPPSFASEERPACGFAIRIWDCRVAQQRRTIPRRKWRFSVECAPLRNSTDARSTASKPEEIEAEAASETERPVVSEQGMSGWCVDLGAGGMRARLPKLERVPERMQVKFCLPVSAGMKGRELHHTFCLIARVIRAEVCGRQSDHTEIALCFERLPVEEGMLLVNLLA